MKKQPSPPSSKAASKTAESGRAVENDDTPDPKAMGRFRDLAKKVVTADRAKVEALERKQKK